MKFLAPVLFSTLAVNVAYAEVRMPLIFGDHMVLQQDATLPVWGWADPGERISVSFGEQKVTAVGGAKGTWRADLHAITASNQGQVLTVSGTNTLSFQDVVVGDVWIASGQSNMEFGIRDKKPYIAEVDKAADPLLRFFFVPRTTALTPLADILSAPLSYAGETPASVAAEKIPADPYRATWVLCTSESLRRINRQGLGVVPYLFSRDIHTHTGRPVGLIQSAWGGTRAESWTSVSGLKKEPSFTAYVERSTKAAGAFAQLEATYAQRLAEFAVANGAWKEEVGKPYDKAKDAWRSAVKEAKAAGQPLPPEPPAPTRRQPSIHPPDNDTNTPGNIFNAMIAPLMPFAIKGAIWYQGEFNSGGNGGFEYRTLFPRMIEDWREKWGQGDFPFVFVQLPNYGPLDTQPSAEGRGWRWTREAQLKALALPNTAMAVAIDVGDPEDIHPLDKFEVARRLVLAARRTAYGEQLVASGPIYHAMAVEGGAIRLSFHERGGGLGMGVSPLQLPGKVRPAATELRGFGIAGADRNFVWAKAVIDGDSVVVSSDKVPAPVAVRYDFSNSPQGNLYNQEGLPAAPFRTDSWDDQDK